MATQTIPTAADNFNIEAIRARREAVRRANEERMAELMAEYNLYVEESGIDADAWRNVDPGPDFTPRAWGWLS